MKQVILHIVSLLKRFFLSIRFHLHIGIYREENPTNEEEQNVDDEDV